MEKIIFFGLALPALAFVIYLGGSAIMKGFKAKVENKPNKNENENEDEPRDLSDDRDNLSSELNKLVFWAIKILKRQFEKDPYSLSSEELRAIKLYDLKLKEKFNK